MKARCASRSASVTRGASGTGALPPLHFAGGAARISRHLGCQDQHRLPRPDQIDIDLGQKLGVEQRAMLGAAGIVDRMARAEIVEPV